VGGVKIKGDWNFWEHVIKDGDYSVNEIQHTIRYYMSNNGSKIVKKNNTDNREIQIEAGKWMQNIFINYEEKEFSDYDINYDYYIQKVKKEIEGLLPNRNQLSLF